MGCSPVTESMGRAAARGESRDNKGEHRILNSVLCCQRFGTLCFIF